MLFFVLESYSSWLVFLCSRLPEFLSKCFRISRRNGEVYIKYIDKTYAVLNMIEHMNFITSSYG